VQGSLEGQQLYQGQLALRWTCLPHLLRSLREGVLCYNRSVMGCAKYTNGNPSAQRILRPCVYLRPNFVFPKFFINSLAPAGANNESAMYKVVIVVPSGILKLFV
jgi:hypothetical protein